MHTLLDLRGSIPSFIHISDGKLHDVHALDLLLPEPAAIYVMDRGYVDFMRLHVLHLAGAFFVTRTKSNMDAHRVYSAPTDRASGIIADQTIALDGHYSRQHYPEHLRRIRFKDADTGKTLVFLTNRFTLPAAIICALYKSRWQVELFFKWVKQHLRIKRFWEALRSSIRGTPLTATVDCSVSDFRLTRWVSPTSSIRTLASLSRGSIRFRTNSRRSTTIFLSLRACGSFWPTTRARVRRLCRVFLFASLNSEV